MKNRSHFNGVVSALVTPFDENYKIDFKSFESLLKSQYENGIRAFVINGTTGESPNLSYEEIELLVESFREVLPQDSCQLMIGTGSNSTTKTIEFSLKIKNNLKPDALLVVVPYYNKPSQLGMIKHFEAVANAVEFPIYLYNVPGRTVVSMGKEALVSLSKNKYIIGVKEASGDLAFLEMVKKDIDNSFIFLSGDDDTCVEFCTKGGLGVISVVSHIIPKALSEFIETKDVISYKKYLNLVSLLFKEPNPCPVKTALKFQNVIENDEVRLPLVRTEESLQKLLKQEMKFLEIL